MKLVANAGYAKAVQVIVGVTPQGTVVDIGTPSVTVIAGQGVLKDGYGLQVTNVTDPGAGATIPDPGPFNTSFTATALKTKADGTPVLRVDDETGIVSATPQIPGSPPTPWPVQFRYRITAAGQVKVSGN